MRKHTIYLTETDLHKIVSNALYKVFGRVSLGNGIYNLESREDIIKYSPSIWEIMIKSYKKLGGFHSYANINDMANSISLATTCVQDHKIIAAAIYRDDIGGQKLNGCGTIDGSKKSKNLLKQFVKDDIENLQKWHWVEVSNPLEKWFKEMNGNPIPSDMAANLLHKSKSKIKPLKDGVHYQRQIANGNGMVTKAIYGFKDESTYNKVMKKLEEYTGFDDHEDFKKMVNSLPNITEGIDYMSNHPNPQIALAMEVIIQLNNLYEDGCYEISPNMYRYLEIAISVLESADEKNNKQIVSCIRSGKQFLNSFTVIRMHTYDEASYILSPIK